MRRVGGCGWGVATPSSTSLTSQQMMFFFGKKKKEDDSSVTTGDTAAPKAFDVRRIQEFMKATPQQQLEMMQKAANMQRTMGKVPGLGVLARKNADVMDRLIKMQQDAMGGKPVDVEEKRKMEDEVKGILSKQGVDPAKASAAFKGAMNSPDVPPPPPPPRGSGAGRGSTGPSLDDLRNVNLGAEIEALFQELKSVRESKNSYRDKFNAREKECEELQREAQSLRETTTSLRSKLQHAEKDVLLLNSENMALKEDAKSSKELRKQNTALQTKMDQLKANDTRPLHQKIQELESALRTKDDHLRSLMRKLERTRRRDPLLQFTHSCSTEMLQLCRPVAAGHSPDGDVASAGISEGRRNVELAFQQLRDAYDEKQQQSWAAAVAAGGHGAKLMIAAATELLLSWLGSQAKLDASVQFSGTDVAIQELLNRLSQRGFVLEKDSFGDGRYVVSLPHLATLAPSDIGPYGVLAALVLSHEAPQRKLGSHGVRIVSLSPFVSDALVKNSLRTVVQYEACRSGGPGGQAANVSETQISAKLFVDGVFLFKTEAQDSRSAVANKEAATEKLTTSQRKQWNDRVQRFDANRLLQEVCTAHQSASAISTTYGEEHLELLRAAVGQHGVSPLDADVVYAAEALRSVAGTPPTAQPVVEGPR